MRCAGVRSRSVSKLALASFETDLERIPAQRIQAVLVEYKLNDFEDLLEDIGLGNRMALVVARQLMEGSEELELAAQTPENERSEEHTSELQSRENLVCRLLLEKKKKDH